MQKLVKKVELQGKHEAEVWYSLPTRPKFETLGRVALQKGQCVDGELVIKSRVVVHASRWRVREWKLRQRYARLFEALDSVIPSPQRARCIP